MAVIFTDSLTDSASAVWLHGMGSSGHHVGGKIGAILGARVGGVTAERVETAAGMLPDAAALVPMKAQRPEQPCQTGLASGRDIQPNPFADDFGQFVLPRQQSPQAIQDRFG